MQYDFWDVYSRIPFIYGFVSNKKTTYILVFILVTLDWNLNATSQLTNEKIIQIYTEFQVKNTNFNKKMWLVYYVVYPPAHCSVHAAMNSAVKSRNITSTG